MSTTKSLFDFDLIQKVLVGDFDFDSIDEVAIFYDAHLQDKQLIFVYKLDLNQMKLFKVVGTESDGAWFCSTVYNNNFDYHKLRLSGDFNGNGMEDIVYFYDWPITNNLQSIHVLEKSPNLNKFEFLTGYGILTNSCWWDWFHHKQFDYSNFDYYKLAVSGQFYDEATPVSTNKDEIIVFYKDYSEPIHEEEKINIGNSFNHCNYSLSQNYPNPFNPLTTIEYSLAEDGLTTLKLYDILGREVKTLVNEPKKAGNYSIVFNASNLPSGAYIYRIAVGNFITSRKLIILK